MYYIAIIIFFLLIIFYCYIYLLKIKIKKLESKIRKSLNKRTNLVPSIFEITKDYLNKHSEVFMEIIKLRKAELLRINEVENLENILNIEWLIHHELNFIFKISYEKPYLQRDSKFLYIKELISDISLEISENIKIHNNISKIYNNLIKIKNMTIFWILIPIKEI